MRNSRADAGGWRAAVQRLAVVVMLAVPGVMHAADAPVPDEGRALYENHCLECHESGVHVRARRKARSVAAIDGWVRRWAAYLELDWTEEEFGLVRDWLNGRYYGY